MTRVLFLEIDTQTEWSVASLGPAFIAAFMRRFGHEASLFRVTVEMPVETVIDAIRSDPPDLIGVSLTARQWQRAKQVLNAIRGVFDIPVVVGGLQPTFSPAQTLDQPGIDYVCLGEGEKAMLRFVEALDRGETVRNGQIKNIWIKGGSRPLLDQPYEPIDDLPYMARDMLDEQPGIVHMTTQRGCPFPCTYCAAGMYHKLYDGNGSYGRRRSHESVLDELATIRRDSQLNYVIFLDDTFTIHHPWVYEFCKQYGDRLKVPFSLHARVETVSEKMIHQLAKAGCMHITYGVESGSERVRREIMKRPVTNEKFIQVFKWTQEAGIITTANYMLGIPGETRDEMQQTLDLHEQLQPTDFSYFVFYPFPGTHLFTVCQREGYLPDNYAQLPANHRASVLNLPGLTQEDIAAFYDKWTATRAAHTLKRYGPDYPQENQKQVVDSIERFASTG